MDRQGDARGQTLIPYQRASSFCLASDGWVEGRHDPKR